MEIISDVCLFTFFSTDFVCTAKFGQKVVYKIINTLDFLCFCGFDYSLRHISPFSWNSVCTFWYRLEMVTFKFSYDIKGFYLKLYYATDFVQGFNKV